MVERVEVTRVDDIDGSPAQNTITFALDGVRYEIDLNTRHAQRLRDTLGAYIAQARTVERPTRTQHEHDRDQQRIRQTNRELTEQIRGAAQRTRQQTEAHTESSPAADQRRIAESRETATSPPHPDSTPTTTEQPRPPAEKASVKTSSPPVPVPQFSSPID